MKQTKLSKQQKEIITILGKTHDRQKEWTNIRFLNREIMDDPFEIGAPKRKTISNSKKASMSRSLSRLESRGLINKPRPHLNGTGRCKLNEKGLQVYKDLKK